MIEKASDYVFVVGDNVDDGHPLGDLNRIDIRGELALVSLRSPYPIRGEDVAFLLEASQERGFALNGMEPNPGSSVFSRKISSAQMLRVTNFMSYLCQTKLFVKDESQLREFAASKVVASRTFLYDNFPGAFYDAEFEYSDLGWNEVFSRGSRISKDPIVFIERSFNKLVRFVAQYQNPNLHKDGDFDFLKTKWANRLNGSVQPFSTGTLHCGGQQVYGRDVYKTYYSNYVGTIWIREHDITSTVKEDVTVQSGFCDVYINGPRAFWILFLVVYSLKCNGWHDVEDANVFKYKYALVYAGFGFVLTGEMINAAVHRAFELTGISDDDLSIPDGDPATGRSYEGYCYVDIEGIYPIATLRDRTVIV